LARMGWTAPRFRPKTGQHRPHSCAKHFSLHAVAGSARPVPWRDRRRIFGRRAEHLAALAACPWLVQQPQLVLGAVVVCIVHKRAVRVGDGRVLPHVQVAGRVKRQRETLWPGSVRRAPRLERPGPALPRPSSYRPSPRRWQRGCTGATTATHIRARGSGCNP